MPEQHTIKKRHMSCRRCGGIVFEIYNEEIISSTTQDIIPAFALYLGACAQTGFKCAACGLENSTNGVLEISK